MKKNLLLYQFSDNGIKEIFPSFDDKNSDVKYLSINNTGEVSWLSLDSSLNIVINKLNEHQIYISDDNRIGIGRSPLFTYKIDLAVPKDTLMTAFHIGDGSFGFSMGNGTTSGFIPEIIGIGADENDTGLYFVGIAGNNVSSNIPLVIIDGRSTFNTKLSNRPIFGVTSANYNEYLMILDNKGNLKVEDIILENESLKIKINRLIEDINYLKTKIT